MTLPAKRKPITARIAHYPERVYQRHRKWLRSHECVCTLSPKSLGCVGAVEVSHIRNAANAGTGLKPIDSSAVPMCGMHHQEYHRVGHHTFESIYSLDLRKLAAEFASRTPDEKLREVLRDTRPLSGAGVE